MGKQVPDQFYKLYKFYKFYKQLTISGYKNKTT